MFLRSLIAFLALPGVVAIAVPAAIAAAQLRAGGHFFPVGLLPPGWTVCFWSSTLAIYTGIVMLGFHLRVVFGEEPWLARMHGAAWDEYKSRVPRWLL